MISTTRLLLTAGNRTGTHSQGHSKYLKKGDALGIFPEGERSSDGELLQGHTGVARHTLIGHSPILPADTRGIHDILPRDAHVPRSGKKAEIHIGRIKSFRQNYGHEEGRAITRRITDDLMREIVRLAGKEYITEFRGFQVGCFFPRGVSPL